MPVIEVTFYRVACDHPGCHACDVTADYSAWEDAEQADDVAMESGAWLKIGHGPDARYYCERHTHWCETCDRAEPASDLAAIGAGFWSCAPQPSVADRTAPEARSSRDRPPPRWPT